MINTLCISPCLCPGYTLNELKMNLNIIYILKIIWTRDTRQSIQATEHEAGE